MKNINGANNVTGRQISTPLFSEGLHACFGIPYQVYEWMLAFRRQTLDAGDIPMMFRDHTWVV